MSRCLLRAKKSDGDAMMRDERVRRCQTATDDT